MDYETLVMTTAAVVVGSTEASGLAKGKGLQGPPVVAGFGLGVFLFVIGLANQSLGAKFCWFIIVTALVINGPALFDAISPGTTGPNPNDRNKLAIPHS